MSPRTARSRSVASSPPPAPEATAKPTPRLARSAALALLLVTAALYATTHMDQGIDTWISLAGGRDIAAHGVRPTDPFSFNSTASVSRGDRPGSGLWAWLHPSGWINQNWLTHLLLYGVDRLGGLDALVVWKVLTYLLLAGVLALAARVRGAGSIATVAVVGAALVIGRDYVSIRAQDVSNLLASVLVLILVLTSRDARWRWALVPLLAVWANAHGGFIYGLVIIAIAVVGAWLDGSVAAPPRTAAAARPLALAGLASAAVTVALSPYRLTNLTHPMEISVGPDAVLWRVVREWRPLFSNQLSGPVPFVVFMGVAIAALAVCAFHPAGRDRRRLDVTGPAIVLASCGLAVASARFVPLAAFTSAPFVAVWLDDAAAALGKRAGGRLGRGSAALGIDLAVWVVALAAAVAFGVRAARTYFGPWPQDAVRTSVFQRMTYDHQRPWGPCAFLAGNGAVGRMWNFWDEGGFLEFCQKPDAATGAVPLQVFIDGRAQAAFPASSLRAYLDLLNGPGRSGANGVSDAAVIDVEALRTWTSSRLRELGVWIALIPAGRQNTAFARAAASMPDWQLVYADPEHSVFVDTLSRPGRELADSVTAGSARFPDEVSEALTAGFRLLPSSSAEDQQRAVVQAERAYRASPSSLAVLCAARAARSPAAIDEAVRFCRAAGEEFVSDRDRHRAEPGYGVRLDAAIAALEYLGTWAKRTNQNDLVRWAGSWLTPFRDERDHLAERVLW